uniref:acylphosphatase n=1 Tax=Octopus bimaculoides TaxID=37653 RepID=A0A0L8G8W6_OCTBM|eukprot:XP_014783068.1 PREDICTED: acylphosphatase-1-like [Octopus bimaculoides]
MTEGLANLVSIDFEVFGIVQGVFFRKHTYEKAISLNLAGWVLNTYHGTVKGNIQGSEANVEKMKIWLSEVGSPSSRIDKCTFSNRQNIPCLEHKGFRIIKD